MTRDKEKFIRDVIKFTLLEIDLKKKKGGIFGRGTKIAGSEPKQPIALPPTEKKIKFDVSEGELAFFNATVKSSAHLAVAYDVSMLKSKLNGTNANDFNDKFTSLCYDSIVGLVFLEKPNKPCMGAWEIKLAAGPGERELIFDMVVQLQDLTGTCLVIPDRGYISRQGQAAWLLMTGKSSVKKFPLDDYNHHDTEFHKKNHTEDPQDDCDVYHFKGEKSESEETLDNCRYLDATRQRSVDSVNQAACIENTSGKFDFNQMKESHSSFVKNLVKQLNELSTGKYSEDIIKTFMMYAADEFFKTEFEKATSG